MEEEFLQITAEESGERIDALLAHMLPQLSRSAAQRLLEEGRVLLRGAPVRKNYRCAAGDCFLLSLPEAEEKQLLWRLVRTQPRMEAGILSAPEITFEIISDGAGGQKVSYREGKIDYNGVLYDELVFEAPTISTLFAEPSFLLNADGERRQYAGTLKFLADKGKVCAVNSIGVEDYLLSVLSAEAASLDDAALRDRAIALRRSLQAQMARRQAGKVHVGGPALDNAPELLTYLEHRPQAAPSDEGPVHAQYDVCATSHCHFYPGLTPAAEERVRAAIDQTWGQKKTDCQF